MSDKFGSMLDRVQKQQADEAQKAQEQAEAIRNHAKAEFDRKAKPITNIVLPALEEAKAAFGTKGIELVVRHNLSGENGTLGREPTIVFSYKLELGGPNNVDISTNSEYFLVINHTMGGVRCGKQNSSTKQSQDWSDKLGTKKATDLTPQLIERFIERTLNDAVRFR